MTESTSSENTTSGISSNFKFMTAHTAIARTASSAFAISVIWITLKLTSSPLISGFADGMVSLPLFMSFFFGAYIDHLKSKKALAVLSSAIRSAIVLVLILAVLCNVFWLRVLAIYAVAFAIGMTSDILNSIRGSWTKQFLGATQYKSGMSLLESLSTIAQSIGFLLSAVMLTFGIIPAAYGLSLIFLASIFPLLMIRDRDAGVAVETEPYGQSMKSGLAYIGKSGILKAVIVITLFVNLSFGAVGIFFAYLVDIVFQLPALYYGFLFFSLTLGIVGGSMIASKVKGKLGLLNAFLISGIGILMMSLSLFNSIYPDYALSFGMGFFIGVTNVISQTGILSIVKQEMMARVTGAFSTFGLGVTFLSGAIGGILISTFTLNWSFVIIGAIVITVGILATGFKDYYNLKV